jgi:hypothetical protein
LISPFANQKTTIDFPIDIRKSDIKLVLELQRIEYH